MTTVVTCDFEAHCKAAVRRFLRTAVLIDDDIVGQAGTLAQPEPGGDVVAPPFAVLSAASEMAHSEESSQRGSEVAIKPLADAFLDRQIVCGVLNPTRGDDPKQVVARAVEAASVADIMIIDWFLTPGNPEFTKEILTTLLQSDREANGRMRLVIVYTSAGPLTDRCHELRKHLWQQDLQVVELPAELPVLKIGSCRLCFVEKRGIAGGTSVEDLPDLAITEFCEEAMGLMPAFALTTVAAIRDAAHHLIATFRPDLDAAFVGHRMLLPHAEDAGDFALDVILLQLRALLGGRGVTGASLGKSEILSWFDRKFPEDEAEISASKVPRPEFSNAVAEADPTRFLRKANGFHKALFLPTSAEHMEEKEKQVCSELARLATHIREAEGFHPLPSDWKPTLTLGSIVRRSADDHKDLYFLCTQPLCDTLRLEQPTFFSFVELEECEPRSNDGYWLVVRIDGRHLSLRASKKPLGRHFAQFSPDEVYGKVLATKEIKNDEARFFFTDHNGSKYQWMADVDRLKAQRAAAELSSSLGRVGLDEYEWLRRGGRIKN